MNDFAFIDSNNGSFIHTDAKVENIFSLCNLSSGIFSVDN